MIFKYKDATAYDSLVRGNTDILNKSTLDGEIAYNTKYSILNIVPEGYNNIGSIKALLTSKQPMYKYADVNYVTDSKGKFIVNDYSRIRDDLISYKFLSYHDLELYQELGDDTLTPIKYIARQIEMFTYNFDNAKDVD